MSQRRPGRPVAVVTSTIPLTIATFHRELLRQLDQAGYAVHVASSPGRHLADLADDARLTVHPLPMRRDIAPLADARALAVWIRLCHTLKPEVVVSATPKASLLGMLAARLTAVPRRLYYLGGLRLEGEQSVRRAVLVAMERVTGWAATDVVANSASLARRATELRLFRPGVLRRTQPGSSHGVDSEWFAPRAPDDALRSRLGLDPAVPVVGFVGRLTRDKGIDTLINAATALRDRAVRLQLLVVGLQDEPDSDAYVTRLRSAGVPTVVVGEVDDVRPLYALMDLNALPSLREGFPNVVLEAGAMGIATVTTDATGCVDSVRDGETGLVVPVDDPTAFAAAVEALIGDPARRAAMGAAAREWVAADFRPESVVASLLGDLVVSPASSPR